ncbi:hypothetical protein Ciccas_010044, partial [Cichlidogyrus casuarinus]
MSLEESGVTENEYCQNEAHYDVPDSIMRTIDAAELNGHDETYHIREVKVPGQIDKSLDAQGDEPQDRKALSYDGIDGGLINEEVEIKDHVLQCGAFLGAGGFGDVFKVRDHSLGWQTVALKAMEKADCDLEDVANEWRFFKMLSECKFCITTHHAFQTCHFVFILMELAAGGIMLDLYVSDSNPYGQYPSEKMMATHIAQIILALEYLNHRRVAHRDLKPENILLDNKCNSKLCDFTFACEADRDNKFYSLCGTAGYMAPEVILQSNDNATGYTMSCDYYSLGCTLYGMHRGFHKLPAVAEITVKNFIRKMLGKKKKIKLPEGVTKEAREVLELLLGPRKQDNIIEFLKNMGWFSNNEINWENPAVTAADLQTEIESDLNFKVECGFPDEYFDYKPIDHDSSKERDKGPSGSNSGSGRSSFVKSICSSAAGSEASQMSLNCNKWLGSKRKSTEANATITSHRYKLVRLTAKDLMKLLLDSRFARSFALYNKFRLSCLCTNVDFTEGEISLASTEFQTRNQTYTQRILAECLGCQIIPEKVCLCCDAVASMPRCQGFVLKPFLFRQPLNRGQHLYKKWSFHKHCTCCFDPVNAEQVVERLTRCYSNTPNERSYWQIAKQVPLLLPWSLKFSVVGLPEYMWLLHDKYPYVAEVTQSSSHLANEGGCYSEKIHRKSTTCGRKIEKSRRTATATTAVVSELIKDSVSRQRVREQELSSRSQLSLNPHHKLSFRLELLNRCLYPSKSHWYVRALETRQSRNELYYIPKPKDKVCASVLTGSLKPSRSSLALFSQEDLSYIFPKNPAPEALCLRVLLEHLGFDANQNNKTDLIASKCYSLDNPILTSCLGFQHLKFDASELLTASTGIHHHDHLRQFFGIPIFVKVDLESYSPKGLSRLIDEVEQEHRTCGFLALSKSFDLLSPDGLRYPGATTLADVCKRGDPIQLDRFQRMIWLADYGIDVNLVYPGMWDKMLSYAKRLDEFVKKGKVLQQRNDGLRITRRSSMDFSFANGLRRVSLAFGHQLEHK